MKRVLVIGMARSGIAAARLLHEKGNFVILNDRKSEAELGSVLDGLRLENVEFRLGEDAQTLLDGVDLVVISPGVPIEHPAVAKAREMGIEVIGEVELAYRMSMGKVMAVTGTNGKTTTTTLLGEICKNAGKRTFVVGNIGAPYADIAAQTQADDMIVCELSSFQLESIAKFHPLISAILNITEDHMNRHKTMERYIELKARVFENQKDGDSVVLNYDDPTLRALAPKAMCRVVWFSRTQIPPFGAFVREETLYFGAPDSARAICGVSEVRIPGPHNLENALAAVACAMQAGIPVAVIRHTLRTFKGVEHRIEKVRVFEGVTYINDSKGTNVDSTIKAVQSMRAPTVLILGGYDKHTNFMPLCEEIVASGLISHVVVMGETSRQIRQQLEEAGYDRISQAYSMGDAIDKSRLLAVSGGNVLLSPACASFDMFKDFEQRGEIFKELVNQLQ